MAVTKPKAEPMIEDDNDEYEVVTSTRGLVVEELRTKLVRCPEIKKPNGKKAQFIMSGLDSQDVQDLHDSNKVMEKGEWTGKWDYSFPKQKLIAIAAKDGSGHRLWHSVEAAIAEMIRDKYPIAAIDRLEAVAQELSAASVEAEEKKSGKTPTSDSGTT